MARRRSLLKDAVASARQTEDAAEPAAPVRREARLDPLASREHALADVAAGRVRDVRLRLVDPSTCRMWSKHNRIYDLLTPESCDDLIASIRAQGRQEVPALVRRLRDDPDYDYEVVSGARRHFSVTHLREVENRREIFFLVEVRDLEDEEAFRLSDLENRAREDISDYERGREYAQALQHYYDGNMTRMAKRMEVSKALLSAYCAVARLPDAVVAAYADPRDIAVRHGMALNPLLKGDSRDALLRQADELAAEQDRRKRTVGETPLTGAEVFRALRGAAATPSRPGSEPRTYHASTGVAVLTAKRARGKLSVEIDLEAELPEKEIVQAVKAALRDQR